MNNNDVLETVSTEEIVEYLAKQKPEGAVAKLVYVLGVTLTGELIDRYQGQRFYLPDLTTQCRAAVAVEVLRLKKLNKNSLKYKLKIDEICKTYDLIKRQVIQILETGKYQSRK